MVMNRRNFVAAALAASVFSALSSGPVSAQEEAEPAYPHMTLNPGTLDEYPDEPGTVAAITGSGDFAGKYVVVELAAGWCPHCADMKPEMDEALANLTAEGANIARLTVIYQEGNPVTGERTDWGYVNTVRMLARTGGFPETQVWKDGMALGGFPGSRTSRWIEEAMRTIPDLFQEQAPVPPEMRPQ